MVIRILVTKVAKLKSNEDSQKITNLGSLVSGEHFLHDLAIIVDFMSLCGKPALRISGKLSQSEQEMKLINAEKFRQMKQFLWQQKSLSISHE